MAEEPGPEDAPLTPEAEAHTLQQVTVFLPSGGIVIPGDRAVVESYPNGVMYVDAMNQDGSLERFVGAPFSMKLGSNRLVQPVTRKIIT